MPSNNISSSSGRISFVVIAASALSSAYFPTQIFVEQSEANAVPVEQLDGRAGAVDEDDDRNLL